MLFTTVEGRYDALHWADTVRWDCDEDAEMDLAACYASKYFGVLFLFAGPGLLQQSHWIEV